LAKNNPFNPAEWVAMTPVERVRHCRIWAAEEQQRADEAPSHIKAAHKKIVEQWLRLADKIEHELRDGPS